MADYSHSLSDELFASSTQKNAVLEDLPSQIPSPIISSPVTTPSPSTSPPSTPEYTHEFTLEPPFDFSPGMAVGPVQLLRPLGLGAFSSVWLAKPIDGQLSQLNGCSNDELSQRTKKDRRPSLGLRPPVDNPLERSKSIYLRARKGADHSHHYRPETMVVAVKMIDRNVCESNERTRTSFLREVEILRHISHPNIVAYLHSFTIQTHHCLILEALEGGELYSVLERDEDYARMTEPLIKRVFVELCHAVSWMHSIGLVHRDIKLENILFTTDPFLPHPLNLPLIKLTDFGLSRFIDPASPLLTARCGSESYAAPELILGRPYDGRQTDAWSCGVVLYALAMRGLPFDREGDERGGRTAYLMRIVNVDYSWSEDFSDGESHQDLSIGRLATSDLKAVVGRLLVRDTKKRAAIKELWSEPWMTGDDVPLPPSDLTESDDKPIFYDDIPNVAKEESS